VREESLRQKAYVRCKVVTDARGVGLGHVKHSRLMRDLVALGQRNYPELVQSVLVVRAPLAMHSLWNFCFRELISERVKAKVQVAGASFDANLASLGIAKRSLPAFLGGARADAGVVEALKVPAAVSVPRVSLFGFRHAGGSQASVREGECIWVWV